MSSCISEATQSVSSVATMQELVKIHRVLLLGSFLGECVEACVGTSLGCGLDLIGLAMAGLVVLPHSRWVHAMGLIVVLLILVWVPSLVWGVLDKLNLAAELRFWWAPGTFSKEHGEGG